MFFSVISIKTSCYFKKRFFTKIANFNDLFLCDFNNNIIIFYIKKANVKTN